MVYCIGLLLLLLLSYTVLGVKDRAYIELFRVPSLPLVAATIKEASSRNEAYSCSWALGDFPLVLSSSVAP